MALKKRDPRSRRLRWAIVTGLVLVGFYVSARANWLLRYNAADNARYEIRVCSASLVLGRHGAASWQQTPVKASWYRSLVWYRCSVNKAWRPYHSASVRLPKKSSWHEFWFPLWYFPVGCVGYLVYLHGLARGVGIGKENRCGACGYDLTGVEPSEDGPAGVVCPECGDNAL